jgi:hypothetical protein
MRRRRYWLISVVAVLAAGLGVTLMLPLLRCWQTESPDGSFIAVARTRPIDQFLSAMPGQGGGLSQGRTLLRVAGDPDGQFHL